MLRRIADGVWVHESDFIQSNAVVVQGGDGVLLIDPGITADEMDALATDLGELGRPVVAGFSTHPDWDHVLWIPAFGDVPRFATARGAAAIADLLAQPDWRDQLEPYLPPDISGEIPMELFGLLTALPAGAAHLPWDGPALRIVEHQGHAAGHAALLIEESGVLVAGDMLSDILIPFFDGGGADPIGDYLAGLDVLESVAGEVELVVPGHGSVGRDIRARIDLDRAYAQSLRDGVIPDDPRVGTDATFGTDWLPDVHRGQAQHLLARPAGP